MMLSPIDGSELFNHPILIMLTGQHVGSVEVGGSVVVHGYPSFTSDCGLLSKLSSNSTVYISVM